MKKQDIYESPKLEIFMMSQDDILTISSDWNNQYDDKGSWKDTWVVGVDD